MNYRHAYHAGNFADVFKHALLARMLVYLMRRDAPLRYLDTHAGIGLYDLTSEAAERTGEWRGGVGRLTDADMPAEIRELLAPYFEAIRYEPGATPAAYPGSPVIAQRLLRPIDRLTLCELHERDERLLARAIGRDRRVKSLRMDGYRGLNAFTPPVERRGLALIDPPFENSDEFGAMATALERAYAKWPTGLYALWYPLKRSDEYRLFRNRMARGDIRRVMCVELDVDTVQEDGPLAGNGLIIVNPPFTLELEARALLPWMVQALARSPAAQWRLTWLAGE